MQNTAENDELLIFMSKKLNISIDEVLAEKEKMKRNETLEKYKKQIYQTKDGRYTWRRPDNKKSVAKTRREDLEKYIIDYDKEHEEDGTPKINADITFREYYPIWRKHKSIMVSSAGTLEKIEKDWKRFYLKASDEFSIIDTPIRSISKRNYEEWAMNIIKNYLPNRRLTKTCYYNMSLIIRQMLDMAVEDGIVEQNMFSGLKINHNVFYAPAKPNDEEQVYSYEEQSKINDIAEKELQDKPYYTVPLAVMLDFKTGIRSCELAALKWKCVQDEYIRIERIESRHRKVNEDGSLGHYVVEIVDGHVKGDFGPRDVLLTPEAQKILLRVKERNESRGIPCGPEDFVFVSLYERMTCRALDLKIRNYCKETGIIVKSMHKVRKTYCSDLFANNVELNAIEQQMGHISLATTKKHYDFNVSGAKQNRERIIQAVNG